MSDLDNSIIGALQTGVPFVSRPFEVVAERVGCDEPTVIDTAQRLSEDGVLREISAVLEGSVLDHDSALCTGHIPADRVDEVAAVVSSHPTVTHNYLRDHHYNLWFTISAPRDQGVDRHVYALARAARVNAFHILRRTSTYKIGVRFDLNKLRNTTDRAALTDAPRFKPDARQQAMLRALQTPLPLVERPFAELCAATDLPEGELLAFANEHLGGAIRRYVATLRHRRLGVKGNGMVVWVADADEVDRAGNALAEAPEVSHCYARNPIEGFPYRLYSMIHGPDPGAVEAIAARLADEHGLGDHLVLHSTREFKKCRLRYFQPELASWLAARGG